MTLSAVRAGLAANIDALGTLNTYGGYTPDQVAPPAAVVAIAAVQYGDAMGHGLTAYQAAVTIYVTDSDPQSAQSTMDTLLEPTGAGSLVAAIEADKTLGGAASSLHVRSAGDYGRIEFDNGTSAITATLTVEVYR